MKKQKSLLLQQLHYGTKNGGADKAPKPQRPPYDGQGPPPGN